MRELLIATRSQHKMAEIRRILGSVPGLSVLSLDDAGVAYDEAEEGLEPHDTFEANAQSKAEYFHGRSGLATVADDSGIEVDALGGAPGVRSKRFAPDSGLSGSALDAANNEHLVSRLGELPLAERTARYVCAAVLVEDGAVTEVIRGTAEGLVLGRPRGWGGFGYDPYFFDPALGKTFAELDPAEKNARSHRGAAFAQLAERLAARTAAPAATTPAGTSEPSAAVAAGTTERPTEERDARG